MAKFSKDYTTFYQREDHYPPSWLLSTHVDYFQINNDVPSEAEAEAEVLRLLPLKAGGHTHLRADHFKTWLREAYTGEVATPPSRTWKVDAACGNSPIYVDHQEYSTGIGVDHPGLNLQGKHRHPGDWDFGDYMEGCGGHRQYPPPGHHLVPLCHPRVSRGKRHGDFNHGYQSLSSACQHLPRPPIPSLLRPEEGLRQFISRPTHQDCGELRSGDTMYELLATF